MQGEMKEWSVRCRVKDLLCKEAKAVANGASQSPWGSGEVLDMGKGGKAGKKKPYSPVFWTNRRADEQIISTFL